MNIPFPLRPVLMLDDDEGWLLSLKMALHLVGMDNVRTCSDSRKLMELVRREPPSVLVLDLCMPHVRGEVLLAEIVRDHPELPVIVLSGLGDLDIAVQCMKNGAYDYYSKTSERVKILSGIRRAVQFSEVRCENMRLKSVFLERGFDHPEAFAAITTQDRKMHALFGYAESVARTGLPVLISGESGTGKRLMARAVHRLSGRSGPFVPVDVARMDDAELCRILFVQSGRSGGGVQREGLVRLASGGTLFLGGIDKIGPETQERLLQLLQQGPYEGMDSRGAEQSPVRLMASAQGCSEVLAGSGRIRKDLCYRLAGHDIPLPPLRQRVGDIPLLLDRFLGEAARSLGKTKPPVHEGLLARLAGYDFPGNVRELRAMAFEAMADYSAGWLSIRAFRSGRLKPDTRTVVVRSEFSNMLTSLKHLPRSREAQLYLAEEALRRTSGNQSAAAELLGISRQALSRQRKFQD
ncbi:MAG: sigma 54-interacting transcriptional regulator [Desulfovibrionaceae bacterium]